MAWRITLTFPDMVRDGDNDLMHRIRNFGEVLFQHFGAESIDLDQVDRTRNVLVVEGIRSRHLRRTAKLLDEMARLHFPERSPIIMVENRS